ncbi:MAG TPA: hypothetical protein PLZ56_13800, partial [Anaerolineae bacterium]|nr:hypothetical protein [Anaerolineae bacterium]
MKQDRTTVLRLLAVLMAMAAWLPARQAFAQDDWERYSWINPPGTIEEAPVQQAADPLAEALLRAGTDQDIGAMIDSIAVAAGLDACPNNINVCAYGASGTNGQARLMTEIARTGHTGIVLPAPLDANSIRQCDVVFALNQNNANPT